MGITAAISTLWWASRGVTAGVRCSPQQTLLRHQPVHHRDQAKSGRLHVYRRPQRRSFPRWTPACATLPPPRRPMPAAFRWLWSTVSSSPQWPIVIRSVGVANQAGKDLSSFQHHNTHRHAYL